MHTQSPTLVAKIFEHKGKIFDEESQFPQYDAAVGELPSRSVLTAKHTHATHIIFQPEPYLATQYAQHALVHVHNRKVHTASLVDDRVVVHAHDHVVTQPEFTT